MSIQHDTPNHHKHILLTKVARFLHPLIKFVIPSLILTLALDIVANLITPLLHLPTSLQGFLLFAFSWGKQNLIVVILLFFIILLLCTIISLVRDIPIPDSKRLSERIYLEFIEKMTEALVPERYKSGEGVNFC